MTDETQGAAAPAAPHIRVMGQYVKDLSFENPGAPNSLRPSQEQPGISVNVDVNVQGGESGPFEVELTISASAKRGEDPLFIAELVYAGLFEAAGVTQEALRPLALVECPRLLFPFARQILAEMTQSGGFPPLMLDPVDFAALYRNQQAQGGEPPKPDQVN